MRATPSVLVAVAASLLAVGCGPGPGGGGGDGPEVTCAPTAIATGPVRIVTTVAPITNIVSVIASGTGATVEGVVPEGANSHTYEPAPSVAVALERADVVIMNGLGLEEPIKRLTVANARDDAVLCELGDAVLPESEYLFDFSFPEAAGLPNPHLWTDPTKVRDYARTVGALLAAVDPRHADRYAENVDRFSAQIDRLDAAIRASTATIPPERRLLLTYHDAYAYFGREYGWTVVGAVQPASFNEPTPREVARLIDQVRDSGVVAVFGSEVFPSRVLEQLAAETGIEYVDDLRDDDLPGRPGDADHSWLALMRFNYVTVIEALGGDATALSAVATTPLTADEAVYPQ